LDWNFVMSKKPQPLVKRHFKGGPLNLTYTATLLIVSYNNNNVVLM